MRNIKVILVVAVTVISMPQTSVCQNLRFPPQDGRTFDILGSLSNLRSNILSIFGNTFNNNNNGQPIRRPVRPGPFSGPPPPPPSRPAEPQRQPPPPPLPPAPLPFSSGSNGN